MNNLYEVLEICLRDIEQGADIETVLFRYPDLADELRPILEGSVNARSMAIVAPSVEVVRRNRAKVLQHAARMREGKARSSSRRIWFVSLRRLAVTLAVVATLFVSGTGLVRAASTTLPGDNLYPVKRTWEDVLLLFTFNVQQRDALEVEHENERLHELREVFAEGRSAEVEFSSVVTSQNGNEWLVSPGITILVSAETEVLDGPITIGSAVRVKGYTQGANIIVAERINVLPPDAKLPDEVEVERDDHEGRDQQKEDHSGKGSEGEEPKIEETQSPESESKDESSNSGSGSNNSGSDSNDNGSDDNSGSGSNDNGGGDNHGGDDQSSGGGSDDGGGHSGDSGGDSGGGGDSSGSGGGGGDD